ncbi:hypothetical protein DYH56_12590 [Psychrilyobacter piezotolerans]|uniref:Uncharacterized protein n=1 Tax=Psychrilyobacter piezotolerans TaxID=2293438 RepID=A0ABX9KED0_9FUSO|nr:hypothetical protein DV867_12590 [Psychrilyobacter sp. S5]REI40008.1 hypothetical protein DYH56_12590 [Psychrilyobacter piezotolerans]
MTLHPELLSKTKKDYMSNFTYITLFLIPLPLVSFSMVIISSTIFVYLFGLNIKKIDNKNKMHYIVKK